MKKILCSFKPDHIPGCTQAQTKVNENIPPFKILKADSTWFTAANLKKDKPVMIIYFSPDCSALPAHGLRDEAENEGVWRYADRDGDFYRADHAKNAQEF